MKSPSSNLGNFASPPLTCILSITLVTALYSSELRYLVEISLALVLDFSALCVDLKVGGVVIFYPCLNSFIGPLYVAFRVLCRGLGILTLRASSVDGTIISELEDLGFSLPWRFEYALLRTPQNSQDAMYQQWPMLKTLEPKQDRRSKARVTILNQRIPSRQISIEGVRSWMIRKRTFVKQFGSSHMPDLKLLQMKINKRSKRKKLHPLMVMEGGCGVSQKAKLRWALVLSALDGGFGFNQGAKLWWAFICLSQGKPHLNLRFLTVFRTNLSPFRDDMNNLCWRSGTISIYAQMQFDKCTKPFLEYYSSNLLFKVLLVMEHLSIQNSRSSSTYMEITQFTKLSCIMLCNFWNLNCDDCNMTTGCRLRSFIDVSSPNWINLNVYSELSLDVGIKFAILVYRGIELWQQWFSSMAIIVIVRKEKEVLISIWLNRHNTIRESEYKNMKVMGSGPGPVVKSKLAKYNKVKYNDSKASGSSSLIYIY